MSAVVGFTSYEIPLIAASQQFNIALSGVTYQLTLYYRNTTNGGWTLDMADTSSNPIIQGIPLVTGVDLLAQYTYLDLGGELWCQTASDLDAVPTFDNLGTDGLLFWVVES